MGMFGLFFWIFIVRKLHQKLCNNWCSWLPRMSLGHFTSADPSHATHPLRFLWNLVCW